FGIAMFSRIPLDSATHVDSPPLSFPTIIATVTVNDQPLTLIDTHPMIPITRSQYDARNEQLESLVELTGRATGAVVLIGDLNISLWCHRYRRLEERSGLRNSRRGFGVVPTWPTFMPFAMIPIDHALVSDDIGVIETRTGRRIGSDHLPLVITITI
ncbi:MAG: endonuclease/exonuclease/phosphatase family protein, partial [Woeseiaceae bacterium]